MRAHPAVVGLCFALLCLWPVSAVAESRVDQARALVKDLKFAEAATLLDALETDTSLDAADCVVVLELNGVVQATLLHPDRAVTLFQKMLSLDPGHTLSGYAPRVMTPYYQAKSWLKEAGGPLSFTRAAPTSSPTEFTALRFSVKNDALSLATQVRVHWRGAAGGWQTAVVTAGPSVEVPVKGADVESWAELLGAGSRVWKRLDSEAAPFRDSLRPPAPAAAPVAAAAPPALVPAPQEPPTSPPLVDAAPASPRVSAAKVVGYVLAALGAVAFGLGVYFGVSSSIGRTRFTDSPVDANGRSTVFTQAEAEALSRLVQTQAVTANTFFGVGSGLVVGGVASWLVGALTGDGR